jgi:hypothetical protein
MERHCVLSEVRTECTYRLNVVWFLLLTAIATFRQSICASGTFLQHKTLGVTSSGVGRCVVTCCKHACGRSERLDTWTNTNHDSARYSYNYETNSIEQEPFKKAAGFSTSHEIRHILWSKNVHYRVNNSPPLVSILSHINPVHSHSYYLFNILLNMILPSTSRSLTLYAFFSPMRATYLAHFFLLEFDHQNSVRYLQLCVHPVHRTQDTATISVHPRRSATAVRAVLSPAYH